MLVDRAGIHKMLVQVFSEVYFSTKTYVKLMGTKIYNLFCLSKPVMLVRKLSREDLQSASSEAV